MDIESENNYSYQTRFEILFQSGIEEPLELQKLLAPHYNFGIRKIQKDCKKMKKNGNIDKKKYDVTNRFSLDEEEKATINQLIKTNKCKTSKEIIEKMELNICPKTMINEIHKQGFEGKKTKKIPLMRDIHIDQRFDFAKKYLNIDGRNVIFADETSIGSHTFPDHMGIESEKEHQFAVPKYPTKFHIWGGICYYGVTKIHVFTENMDAIMYKDILQKKLLPSIKYLYPNKIFKLLHDKDPKHTSTLVKKFIEKKSIDYFEDWPASSPDLNPIENVGAILKNNIKKQCLTDVKMLKKEVKKIGKNLPIETCQKLAMSMQCRLEKVIEYNGNYINY